VARAYSRSGGSKARKRGRCRSRGSSNGQSNGNDSHFRACRRKRSYSPYASERASKSARAERVRGALLSLLPLELPFSLSPSLFGDRRFLAATAAELAARESSSSLLSSAKERRERECCGDSRAGEMPRELQRTRAAKAAAARHGREVTREIEERKIKRETDARRKRDREKECAGHRDEERHRARDVYDSGERCRSARCVSVRSRAGGRPRSTASRSYDAVGARSCSALGQ